MPTRVITAAGIQRSRVKRLSSNRVMANIQK
jgi:hypothetical protein